MSETDQYEWHLHRQLSDLREAFDRAAKPIIDELIRIDMLKPRTYLLDPQTMELTRHEKGGQHD